MFLIIGMADRTKVLPFEDDEMHICKSCGQYCKYEIIMKYSVLTLFFIPVIKWNKRFFAKSSCCKTLFDMTNEAGNDIYKGRKNNISDDDIHKGEDLKLCRHCDFCGGETPYEYQYNYCLRCGHKY